jgi:hypothetical protein
MIRYPIVRLVIGSNTLVTGLETRSIGVKVRQHTTATGHVSRMFIIFSTTTVGSVGRYSGRLVNTAATILMLVAVLSPFACTGEPFIAKLIFCDFHSSIYMVGPPGLEPGTNGL